MERRRAGVPIDRGRKARRVRASTPYTKHYPVAVQRPLNIAGARAASMQLSREAFERALESAVDHDTEIDLKKLFPLSKRYAFRQAFALILLFTIFWGVYFSFYGFNEVFRFSRAAIIPEGLIFVASLGVVLARLIYFELQRRCFEYKTVGFRLSVSRGIFLKHKGSVPLLPLTEVHLHRNFVDMIFGLWRLKVLTALDLRQQFVDLAGLSFRNAHGLQRFLARQLNRQISIPQEVRGADDSEVESQEEFPHYDVEIEEDVEEETSIRYHDVVM